MVRRPACGTGVAIAPEPSGVAFAPEWSGFRGECDPCFCVAGAKDSEPQKDLFHLRESFSRVMLEAQRRKRCGCYVPTAISINFQHAMDATVYHAFRATAKTVWMLRCNSHFIQYAPKSPLNVPMSPGFTLKALKGWVTYWIERQVTICPQVPPKGSPFPLNVPLCPGFTQKGWVTYWKYCGSGANVTPVPQLVHAIYAHLHVSNCRGVLEVRIRHGPVFLGHRDPRMKPALCFTGLATDLCHA